MRKFIHEGTHQQDCDTEHENLRGLAKGLVRQLKNQQLATEDVFHCETRTRVKIKAIHMRKLKPPKM